MTREEAIAHGKEQLEVFGGEHREFIEMAIKALEQCEVWNGIHGRQVVAPKGTFNRIWEDAEKEEQEPVLDKIRAEIDGLTYYWCEVNPRTVIDDVIDIIDKYRAESEE